MLEVEVKYRCSDPAKVEVLLAERGAVRHELRTDIDQYFNAPDRDFAQTDEALRLRRIGNQNRLTYKGPKQDATTKTRTEIEVPLAEGGPIANDARNLLASLGYRPVAIVTKQRAVFQLSRNGFDIEVCLDQVEGVGSFVEIEIGTESERFEAAKNVVLQLANELGLENPERRSYLEMLLASSA